ncbi:caprin homolog [Ochlerotatus camptorhynchus]|uniref:caprin homolog n=1 Tax=Ochlerotatus camptorhynchus TaxID=644619 RepID=UPI0031DDDF87
MPSLKMIENSKTSTPESFGNAVESGGNDECNSSKEANHSQIVANSSGSNNGNAKEQPANPLQQIILIIEHKIRNLEKRKNKLESYKSIEKSGKKLTGDQKIAVSKYDECLTSLELTRELCKQFQSIVAAANKEAKKEAKRSVFVRAQQENAKIREVLIIQDVLKRFTEANVREDFRQGTNGACKIADSDLMLLEQLYEETLAKRPKTSAEPTFVTAVKQAADHLSAIVDGRNKPFADVTYVHIKNVLAEIQNCGYFDKDIITVEEEETDNAEDKDTPTEADETGQSDEPQEEESLLLAEQNSQPKVNMDPSIAPVLSGNEAPSMKVFAEAPAATAVPTPSFPTQPSMVRQIAPNPPSSSVPDVGTAPTLVAPPVHMPTQIINANNGLSPASTPNVHSAAAIIVPTGPVTVPMMQPTATPMPPVPGQQLNATTVQAVENAYFKQHYIQQQQMRPIHEVIGTGNFFFLQESEIDKPDVISTSVPFGNPLTSTNVTAQQTHPQQVLIGQATNSSNQLPVDQQGVPAQQATMIVPQQQNVMMGAQHPPTFNNQPFQNLTSPAAKSFNHSMQPQAMETRQISQPMNAVPHSRSPVVSKSTDHGHIPGFTTKHTTVVATQSVAPKEQSPIVVQPAIPDESQNNAQRQSVQKAQMPQQKPMVAQQGSALNQPFNANLQQYPSLVQNIHESPNQAVSSNLTQNLPGLMVDGGTDKLKASLNLSDKFPLNQPHLNQQHTKLRHDEWNRGSDFPPNTSKSEDQWSNNAMARTSAADSGSNNKGQYTLSNQAKPQPVSIANENSVPNATGPVVNETSKRHEQNDNMTSNYVQELQGTHGGSHQAQPTYGHRNSRSASNSQYQQNNGTNARFDNGINNSSSTFFKNNERFYQQNQTSNYGTNKSDSSYHQRSSMFKNRNDNNGNPPSRGAGYSSSVPSGGTAPPSNNGNNSGNFGSGIDYRSNARPVNSTRNTGPPSSRPHQRNHSGNSYGGPRGGSNTRAPQSSINA